MKKAVCEIAFCACALVLLASAEELLPKPSGAGFPLLLSASIWFGARRGLAHGAVFAAAAGGAEDALGLLPPGTCAAFFAAAAAIAAIRRGASRRFETVLAAAVAASAMQVWLWMWLGSNLYGGVFARILAAFPAGLAAAAATFCILGAAESKAGLAA